MTESPLISVVMGVFNSAALLPETVDSVLAQTERRIEFIIVDDGSTEPSVAGILSDYERRDARVRVIRKSNEGLTVALIAGCASARGRYIARTDVGDVLHPTRLEKQRAFLDTHAAVVLVSCWTEFCGPAWELLYVHREGIPVAAEGVDLLAETSGYNTRYGPSHHGSVMFRAEAYRLAGGYREPFYYGQDWDLWFRLAACGKFAGLEEILYRCRVFPDSISMRNARRQTEIHKCSFEACQARRRGDSELVHLETAARIRPPPRACLPEVPGRRSSAAGYYFIGEALRRNGDERSLHYLLAALRRSPLSPKIWLRCAQQMRARFQLGRMRKADCP